jgi:hypothetical protein
VRAFKPVIAVGLLLVAVLLVTALQLYYIKLPSVTMTMRIVLVGALTINIIALLTLMFFVGKNLFKLSMERRLKILGYRFRTRLMAVFGTLILIPSLFLFIVASGLATNYIKSIFSPETKRPLTQSIELARLFYDLERQRLLDAARRVADGHRTPRDDIAVKRYERIPPAAGELIRDGFDGQEGTEVVTGEHGDTIRAVAPLRAEGKVVGVVVLEEMLPVAISRGAEQLRDHYEDYLKLESFQNPKPRPFCDLHLLFEPRSRRCFFHGPDQNPREGDDLFQRGVTDLGAENHALECTAVEKVQHGMDDPDQFLPVMESLRLNKKSTFGDPELQFGLQLQPGDRFPKPFHAHLDELVVVLMDPHRLNQAVEVLKQGLLPGCQFDRFSG